MSRPLKVTATQRLGKRVDRLDAEVRSHGLRLDGLAQRVQELAQTFAETAHMGNFEAMYRLEREENIKLRQNGHAPVETTILEGWIAQLESLVHQLHGQQRMCMAHNLLHPVGDCGELPLTSAEHRLVEKFGLELSKGIAAIPEWEWCKLCGQWHPLGWCRG